MTIVCNDQISCHDRKFVQGIILRKLCPCQLKDLSGEFERPKIIEATGQTQNSNLNSCEKTQVANC